MRRDHEKPGVHAGGTTAVNGPAPVSLPPGLMRPERDSYAAALPSLRARVQQAPDDPAALAGLAEACAHLGLWPEALSSARRCHHSTRDPRMLFIIADSLYWLGERDELDTLWQAVSQSGDAASAAAVSGPLVMHLLKRGDIEHGLSVQQPLRDAVAAPHPVLSRRDIPWWDGAPFAGTLLVNAMQGLGEEILVSSYFAELPGRCGRAVIECDPRLLPLFRRSFPRLDFVSRHGQGLAAAASAATGMRKTIAPELARLFHARHRERAARAWLQADADRAREFHRDYAQRWPGERLVGICWRSFRVPWGFDRKSVALADLQSTLRLHDTRFLNLQYGPVSPDLEAARDAGLPLPHADPSVDALNDLDALAAQIAALDAVVTTSNSTAHLAGALGKPCLVLLPRRDAVLWCWGYGGESTPWYPSVRLVRGRPGADRAAFDRQVAAALEAFVPLPPRTGEAGTP